MERVYLSEKALKLSPFISMFFREPCVVSISRFSSTFDVLLHVRFDCDFPPSVLYNVVLRLETFTIARYNLNVHANLYLQDI